MFFKDSVWSNTVDKPAQVILDMGQLLSGFHVVPYYLGSYFMLSLIDSKKDW